MTFIFFTGFVIHSHIFAKNDREEKILQNYVAVIKTIDKTNGFFTENNKSKIIDILSNTGGIGIDSMFVQLMRDKAIIELCNEQKAGKELDITPEKVMDDFKQLITDKQTIQQFEAHTRVFREQFIKVIEVFAALSVRERAEYLEFIDLFLQKRQVAADFVKELHQKVARDLSTEDFSASTSKKVLIH
jgi:hypothetical protein